MKFEFLINLIILILLFQPQVIYAIHWKKFVGFFHFFQKAILRGQSESARYRADIVITCQNSLDEDKFELNIFKPESITLLDVDLPLAFIVHGWQDGASSDWIVEIQESWLEFQEINVCTVDWGSLASHDYKYSMMSIFDVGITLADVIEYISDYGFTTDKITLVGYSLGAHAVGFTGQLLHGNINEIIGLDPAGPLFSMPTDVGTDYRLDETDAKFVQVIHTSGGTLGTHLKSGHADFYPNGGVPPQTNCVFTFLNDSAELNRNPVGCSHSVVTRYFQLSMNPKYQFIGWQCSSFQLYMFGFCKKNQKSRFGIHSERNPGNYFFTTELSSPYVKLIN